MRLPLLAVAFAFLPAVAAAQAPVADAFRDFLPATKQNTSPTRQN